MTQTISSETSSMKIAHMCGHLLNRDRVDFEDYWLLLSYDADRIEYHIGFDFQVGPNELVIVDEADALMFNDPIKFQ